MLSHTGRDQVRRVRRGGGGWLNSDPWVPGSTPRRLACHRDLPSDALYGSDQPPDAIIQPLKGIKARAGWSPRWPAAWRASLRRCIGRTGSS